MAAVVLVALLYLSVLVWLLARTAYPARARPASIVWGSDRRSAAAGWLLLSAVILAPLAVVAIAMLLAMDVRVWMGAARAARRQRRGELPAKPGVDFGLGPDWMLEPSTGDPYRTSAGPVLGALGSPRDAARAIAGNMGCLLLAAFGATTFLSLWENVPSHRHLLGSTRTALSTARSATVIWRADVPDAACPTVDQLKAAKVLDWSFDSKDPWGNPILLTCTAGDIVAQSAGPDRKLGTEDDLRVPSQ
jgi:hypothetical protein